MGRGVQHEGVQNHQGAAGTGQLRKLAALVHEVAELAGTGARRTCLQVAPRMHRGPLLEGHHDEETGFLGLSPQDRRELKGVSVEMEPGDLLCFTQKTPHRALPNQSDAVRWSLDVRYEATDHATESGKAKGFVARSPRAPATVVPYAEWEQRAGPTCRRAATDALDRSAAATAVAPGTELVGSTP